MEQALYRKNRPKKFSDVVGQDHITKTLTNAIKQGRISHAYLFTGPKGVGKTSIARILAHEVNGLAYTDESIHLDIIEIDAASNRRIDEIREIREKVHIAPTSAKYKVYIIDEVHMLTREAFNALLKTLEEPPEHCIFILATTEGHKVPETITSRTQKFEFKPISNNATIKQLGSIAKNEKIDIDTEALDLLASFGGGSFRDSIGLLDQLSSSTDKIDAKFVSDFLGLPSSTAINKLLLAIQSHDQKLIVETLDELVEFGSNPTSIAEALAKEIRTRVLERGGNDQYIMLLKNLLDVPSSSRPNEYLEIILLESSVASKSDDDIDPTHQNKGPSKSDEVQTKKTVPAESTVVQVSKPISNLQSNELTLLDWPKVLEAIKNSAASIYTALRLAEPILEDGTLNLIFQFPLHMNKIDQAKNKQLISMAIEAISGSRIAIVCSVDKSQFKNQSKVIENVLDSTSASSAEPEELKTINNIFGGSEVLES